MTNTTQWNINKYGQLIERSDIVIKGISIITTRIYTYEGRYYVEVWDRGYCIHFGEIME